MGSIIMKYWTECKKYSQNFNFKEITNTVAKVVGRHKKPPYSYALLVMMAIISSPKRKLRLNQIYKFIPEKFSFFRNANQVPAS